MKTLPRLQTITLRVDTSKFFDAAQKMRTPEGRISMGDRFAELCLNPEDWRLAVSLEAFYGITIIEMKGES